MTVKRLLFSLLFLTFITALPAQADIPEICSGSDNLLQNCRFNDGTSNWNHFTEEGNAAFMVLQGGGECHAPNCPAGYMVIEDYFVGGIYQQIPAVAGNNYQANIVWLGFDSLTNDKSINDAVGGIGRKMGIDPLGGTDPRASSIVWGQESWEGSCRLCNGYEVVAAAQSDKITIFLRFDDRWKVHAREKGYPVPPSKDQFWLDDIGARQVSGEAVAAAAPTNTPEPPTNTPPPTTDTPAPEPTVAATTPKTEVAAAAVETATATPEATMTVTATLAMTPNAEITTVVATATLTTPVASSMVAANELPKVILPPPTLTPTAMPTSTPTRSAEELVAKSLLPAPEPFAPQVQPTQALIMEENWVSWGGSVACGLGVLLITLALFLLGVIWLYRLGSRPFAPPTPNAEDEPMTVEVIDDGEDL